MTKTGRHTFRQEWSAPPQEKYWLRLRYSDICPSRFTQLKYALYAVLSLLLCTVFFCLFSNSLVQPTLSYLHSGLCAEQPVSRPDHNGQGFRYDVQYRPHHSGDNQEQRISREVTDPSISELEVTGVPTFQPYEIFVQSVNDVDGAPILGGTRKIGYSGEGSK